MIVNSISRKKSTNLPGAPLAILMLFDFRLPPSSELF